ARVVARRAPFGGPRRPLQWAYATPRTESHARRPPRRAGPVARRAVVLAASPGPAADARAPDPLVADRQARHVVRTDDRSAPVAAAGARGPVLSAGHRRRPPPEIHRRHP